MLSVAAMCAANLEWQCGPAAAAGAERCVDAIRADVLWGKVRAVAARLRPEWAGLHGRSLQRHLSTQQHHHGRKQLIRLRLVQTMTLQCR